MAGGRGEGVFKELVPLPTDLTKGFSRDTSRHEPWVTHVSLLN